MIPGEAPHCLVSALQSYHHFCLKHSLTTLFGLSKILLQHDAYANGIPFLKFQRSPSQLHGPCPVHVDIKSNFLTSKFFTASTCSHFLVVMLRPVSPMYTASQHEI